MLWYENKTSAFREVHSVCNKDMHIYAYVFEAKAVL